MSLSMKNIKRILKKDLLELMTPSTFGILLRKVKYWKTIQDENIIKQRAEEVGYLLCRYPADRLMERVCNKNDPISGIKVIQYYRRKNGWIKRITGWDDAQIYQIHAVLFKHGASLSKRIRQRAFAIFAQRFEYSIASKLRKCIRVYSDIDLETINYEFKNGHTDLQSNFTDTIMDFVSNHSKQSDGLRIYKAVVDCFIPNYTEMSENLSEYALDLDESWTCCNCSNYNFSNFIDGKINTDLSICSLCGITQRDAVIMILKHYDTYTMVNSACNDTNTMAATETKADDIDEFICSAMEEQNFHLFCLHDTGDTDNNNEPCPSVLRLARQLLIYKRWISKINDDIISTTQVDIVQYVTDDRFKLIFGASIQSIDKIATNKEVVNVLMDLLYAESINMKEFLSLPRKSFLSDIANRTSLKTGTVVRLYKAIMNSLKDSAQTAQFGTFLNDFTSGAIDRDYHHVFELHIKNGNKTTMENAFRFFERVLHFDDLSQQCKSMNRMAETEKLCLNENAYEDCEDGDDDDNKENVDKVMDVKDLWASNQYYIQNQLDVIHSFLAHSDWQCFFDRYVKSDDIDMNGDGDADADANSNPTGEVKWSIERLQQNKHKYVSDLQESTLKSNYGFGVDHQHPHLSPNHFCIRDELLFNKLHALSVNSFNRFLVKSLKKRRVALGVTYRKVLVCTYYKKEYNLARNESIGIRHILALVIYSGHTQFCTAFRETYRRISNETNDDQVTERHQEIYYYARALYEAIEFFGSQMNDSDMVYHGLNRKLFFQKFTAYFNQPMSTTKSLRIANQFACGLGITLTLKSGAESEHNVSKIPKYLSIAWLSQYPHEEELLFYGGNVLFKIHDIHEAKGHRNIQHRDDLSALNTFQNIVHNRCVHWPKSAQCKALIRTLHSFIVNQIEMNMDSIEEIPEPIENYGEAMFAYFCNHPNTTSIGINNYYSLPTQLKRALFLREKSQTSSNDDSERKDDSAHPQSQHTMITFMSLVNLFQHLREIKLNNLNLNKMLEDKQLYIDGVLRYIKHFNYKQSFGAPLMKVVFQSEPQQNRKNNAVLQQLAKHNVYEFDSHEWNISYTFDLTNTLTHSLIFINTDKTVHHINALPKPSMVIQNAKWMDCLSYFMQIVCITAGYIRIKVLSDKTHGKLDQSIVLQQVISDDSKSCDTDVNKRITIKRNTYCATSDIAVNNTQNSYHLALFDVKNTDDPLPHSNQLRFELLHDSSEYPPHNTAYKPRSVDISSVFSIKNVNSSTVDVYWSVPSCCFGDISYKVIKNANEQHDGSRRSTIAECITSLPYTLPLSEIPVSFRIVAQTIIDGRQYESDASKTIAINHCDTMTIKSWEELPNVLQILSVDSDEIEIKFTLKKAPQQKMKCRIEGMKRKESNEEMKWSENMTVRRTDFAQHIRIDANTEYSFAIFSNDKQISNEVHAHTPINDFQSNYNYSPSVESVQTYYDTTKENILIMCNSKVMACDTIIYEIKSSNKAQSEQVMDLPYKISTPHSVLNNGIEIQIRAISIINGNRYEGKWSKPIYIDAL
eukprot:80430_1